MNNIKTTLIEKYGYTEYEAEITTEDLNQMDSECKEKLDDYLSGNEVSDFRYGEFSVDILVNDYGCNVISAILTISTLKNDYENLSRMLKKGFK